MEFSEPKGIYLQIAEQIRERILRGEWKAGQRIPSIRELALELGVNPNTVTRSYQKLLERELITNQRGRGYFVGERATERARDEMKDEFMRDELPRIIGTMRLLGIGVNDIADAMTQPSGIEQEGDDSS